MPPPARGVGAALARLLQYSAPHQHRAQQPVPDQLMCKFTKTSRHGWGRHSLGHDNRHTRPFRHTVHCPPLLTIICAKGVVQCCTGVLCFSRVSRRCAESTSSEFSTAPRPKQAHSNLDSFDADDTGSGTKYPRKNRGMNLLSRQEAEGKRESNNSGEVETHEQYSATL